MPPPDASPVSAAALDARLERASRMLQELSEAGMRLVRAIDFADAAAPIEARALAFSRVSRAIRLNILLDLRLEEIARAGPAALGAESTRADAADPVDAADDSEPVEHPERPERGDRLEREAADEALRLVRRPLPEVVAAICRGYGLTAEETARAQAPFAALIANDDGPEPPPPRPAADDPPAGPAAAPRPKGSLKSRLLAGTARPRGMGP